MLDDANEVGSPGWWLLRLGRQLHQDARRFHELDAYHRGDPPVPYGNRKMREAYRRLQRQARSNYAALVAETLLERMKVVGFRSGSAGTDATDDSAWQWWQRNNLDANSLLVHRCAVVMSRAYVLVGNDPSKPGKPLVTGEDPRQVIHESDPADRRRVRAALKTWWDDVEKSQQAVVYLPDKICYFRSDQSTQAGDMWSPQKWVPDTAEYSEGVVGNPFGEVPVVPFINRPNLSGEGLGEFEDVTDVLDRIATTMLDRLVIASMQAYRQRWATGVDPTDEHGDVQNYFDPGADLMWIVPDSGAKFGDFASTDVGPIINAIESDVQHLAAITRTPPHYLIGAVVNVSGDALAAAETGLVSKVCEREIEFGEAWEQVYRLAGMILHSDIPADAEVIWKDPQFHTLTELAAASVQLDQAGVPWKTRMRMLDFTPGEIERMESERMQDSMLAGLSAPTPPPGMAQPAQASTPGPAPTPQVNPNPPTPSTTRPGGPQQRAVPRSHDNGQVSPRGNS